MVNLKKYIAEPKEIEECEAIVTLSFGLRPENKPGRSNEKLAEWSEYLHREYNLPLVLQWEIADCLLEPEKTKTAKVIREHRIKGKYLDTYEVLSQAKDFCDEKGWKKILLAAHQDHLPRAIKTAKKLGFVVKISRVVKFPYDSLSVQPWTRNKWRFKLHEIPANLLYLLKGYI